MPYCENCGSQVSAIAKFCGNCGASRTQTRVEQAKSIVQTEPIEGKPAEQPQPKRPRLNYYSPPNAIAPSAPMPIMQPQTYSAPPQTTKTPSQLQQAPMQTQPISQPQVGGEATVGVILFRRMKSMGRYDTFAGVVTTQRLIFAQLTADMINAAAQQAREQAKAEGKGFFGQWANQLRGTFGYTNKYLTMPPEAILAETAGNFALYNSIISQIKVHLKGDNSVHNERREFEAEIFSSSGTYKFRMEQNNQFVDVLKQVYGDRVKMPFGYYSKSVNIKF